MSGPGPEEQRRLRFSWSQGVLLAIVIAALVWLGIALAPMFSRERVETLVRGAGEWGPLILVGLQVAQILVAPIPGVFVPILAGILYGPIVGPLLASTGTVLGSAAAYTIGWRAGRPLLERWVGRDRLERAHALLGGKRWLALIPL
ncbi:MAG: TVP38/TMEM64 family protein, partial [Candidatus Latescibacteria bacterium]|nr:TVP38/TMEM64 family protein [Candidatus Latescibacterota bacterium]